MANKHAMSSRVTCIMENPNGAGYIVTVCTNWTATTHTILTTTPFVDGPDGQPDTLANVVKSLFGNIL